MPITTIELRDVDSTESCYNEFKSMHEDVCYSEIDSSLEVKRKPIIKSFKEYQKCINETNMYFIVAENAIVGYIIMDAFYDEKVKENVCKIQEIVIKKEYQKQGYGRKAIKQLITELSGTEYGIVRVFSATIATDNFYSSCNFRYVYGDTYEYRLK